MQTAPKVQYIMCELGGYHLGEVMNMVCLESPCLQKQLGCCACIQQAHKNHNVKPLRVAMLEADQASAKITPVKFNIDSILGQVKTARSESLEIFNKYKQNMADSLNKIQQSINHYFNFICEQIKMKNIDPKQEIAKAFQVIQVQSEDRVKYVESVKRISRLLGVKTDDIQLNENDITNSISINTQQMKARLQKSMKQSSQLLNKYEKEIKDSQNTQPIWKNGSLKFSQTMKHNDIKILPSNIVKSINSSGYKFIIMEPNLQAGANIKYLAFKIKESSSNWVAVGVCHPKIVKAKNYGFNFSSIGHGAYMVSANGGSWSHIKAEQNNSVKAFKFVKGDIIQITMNTIEKTLVFKKGTETYTITFEPIANDQLSPCVLFYYLNDEVQFLPNYKG